MTSTCEWCGRQFDPPHRKGPKPKWCSASHRQRAYSTREATKQEMLLHDAWTLLEQVETEQMPLPWRVVHASWAKRYQDTRIRA